MSRWTFSCSNLYPLSLIIPPYTIDPFVGTGRWLSPPQNRFFSPQSLSQTSQGKTSSPWTMWSLLLNSLQFSNIDVVLEDPKLAWSNQHWALKQLAMFLLMLPRTLLHSKAHFLRASSGEYFIFFMCQLSRVNVHSDFFIVSLSNISPILSYAPSLSDSIKGRT